MAGSGQRFVSAGYADPKPAISVNGKKIIEYILEMFDANDEYIFICNEIHLTTTNMPEILKKLCPRNPKTRCVLFPQPFLTA
jgi:NDP-sugar pyrophosphorylase family protein